MAGLPDFFGALTKGFKRLSQGAKSFTQTFNKSSASTVLSAPTYRDHLNDLLDLRQAQSANDLLQVLFKQDPDVSAAVGSYLTLADTPMRIVVKDVDDQIDEDATKEVHGILRALTSATDYTKGFTNKPSLSILCQELRYMLMLRGAIGGEIVFDKQLIPSRLQQVDMQSIQWFEKASGEFTPQQKSKKTGDLIDLNIPTFFVAFHRRDPTTMYPSSDFVSAINTIAARTQVINDLYRIMRITGFPRMKVEVLEEVLRNNMPANVKDDPEASKAWLSSRLNEIAAQFQITRADQTLIHMDSTKVEILNKDKPGAALQITEVIETLNAQNQAGLKTMATVIGRAKSGTNTSTVEARIAAMNADQLNRPLEQFLSQMLTFLLNVYGTPGFVEVSFCPAEMRPDLELEPQRVMRSARLLTDLSLGLITDAEYHWQVHGRFAPEGAPVLMGTNFENAGAQVDTGSISPNQDALGRSVASPGSKSARSKQTTSKLMALLKAFIADEESTEPAAA